MRKIKPSPPFGILANIKDRTLFDLTLKNVTPIFGGSAVAGSADIERPVSAKSIRGHLRFWWRACRAGSYSTTEDLYKKEQEIWGGIGDTTGTPSSVDVSVEILQSGNLVKCAEFEWDNERGRYRGFPTFARDYPPYAIFPFQGQLKQGGVDIENLPAKAIEDCIFRLRIEQSSSSQLSSDDLKKEVSVAVWSWILFGGVGARTRRGCGSLFCENRPFPSLSPDPLSSIKSFFETHVQRETRILPIPIINDASLIVAASLQTPMQAWNQAVNLMRDFRQGEDYGRNRGNQRNRPGRSRWPEPDSLREEARQNSPMHKPEHPDRGYYPRADLGLPIIFHFKDGGEPNPDMSLDGGQEGLTRMASPIILKALPVSSTQARALVLVLNAPHVWEGDAPGVALKQGKHRGRLLRKDELVNPAKATRGPLNEESTHLARTAFVSFARKRLNAKEVKL